MIKRGGKPRPVVVGYLTDEQLGEINDFRRSRGWEPIDKDVVFVGTHVYESRVVRDGYSENDLIAQIESAFSPDSRFVRTNKMTVLQNEAPRQSGYGCFVKDELTLECSTRFPRAELFSVVPRGDKHHKPVDLRKAAEAASLLEKSTETPG